MKAGTRVAHYEVLSVIGRGGMGEVYRARDTKLQRDVALKTLSEEFAADADRVARLEREATVIAALNHPSIAVIYGVEEHDGRSFLVLELVEGGTLTQRIHGKALHVDQALEIAAEIAGALESAHERGVLHRDLKPDNVAFTRDGRVKVLDFGLAKTLSAAAGGQASVTAVRTELGVTVGTAPYMSPEQARGEAANQQTDIWALGITLYEMLTGISPFERNSSTETLACVLEAQPDFTALPKNTPPSVTRLIRRCLEKDRRRRFRDMGDVRIEIEDALAGLASDAAAAPASGARRLRAAVVGAAFVALLALAALGVHSLATVDGAPADVVRLSVANLDGAPSLPYGTQDVALSPDGSQLAYTSRNDAISVRRLSDAQITLLETALGQGANPFFSPDGTWLGAGTLQRMRSSGGASAAIVQHTERPAGAAWGRDGTIVYATSTGLYRVAADGGPPELLVAPNAGRGELLYAWPHWLPNRSALLFTILPARASIEAAQIALLDVETRETRVILTGGTSPRYSPTGHLVYAARQRLFAVAFDPDSATTSGQPVELRGIAVSMQEDNGAAQFALASNGTLAFIEPETPRERPRQTLAWIDRAGNETPLSLEPRLYNAPRVSPDGTRIAFDIIGGNRDVWVWDVGRQSLTRLTDGPNEDMLPLWSRDGRRIYFTSARGGNFDIYSQAADGSSPARLELASPGFQAPNSFSPDGTKLVAQLEFRDISVIDLARSTLEPLLQSDAIEWLGEVSPDGRWLAYDSNESGQFEVYLRPFPDVTGARVQVSAGGGFPRWGPPGSNELYYLTADGAMMAVAVELEPTLRVGRPTALFQFAEQGGLGTSSRPYDVASDGRFIAPRVLADDLSRSVTVTVILNWFEELREQVPIPD